jgi:hypothetical protein
MNSDRRRGGIEPGTRVYIRPGACHAREHLDKHARDRDVGIVSEAKRLGPWAGWVYVQFTQCYELHRLLPEELVRVRPRTARGRAS